MASTKGYSYFKGPGLYVAKMGCVTKHPAFYWFIYMAIAIAIIYQKD